jgi:hypothetical protein
VAGYYFDEQNDYCDRDYPVSCEWRAPGMAAALGLPRAPDAGYERMRDMMLANLWLAAEGRKALSYSRHKPFYLRSRYRPADFTYATILRVVVEIVKAGLALENRTAPGHRGRQSTLAATSALYNSGTVRDDLAYEPAGEPIILRSRGEDRALLSYNDTRDTHRMRMEVVAVREMHASTVIGVTGGIMVGNHLLFERLVTDRSGRLKVKRQYVRIVPGNGGRRIFSERWSLHGRFYCWPQNIPSAARASITINCEPTVELDYRAMHPTLLYNQIGVKLDGDAYDIGPGFDRKEAKAGMMIALNAADEITAVKALARAKGISYDRCRKVFDAVRERHRPIEGAFFADKGVELMNIDSKIAMAVTTGLMAEGIPSISVHDSIIGPAQFRGQIRAKMAEVLERFSGKVNHCEIR